MTSITPSTPFERLPNFRDVGASINSFTGQGLLRSGVFFRSALPDEATAVDRDRLAKDYRIKTIVDLRTDSEHVDQTRKLANRTSSSPITEPSDPAKGLQVPGVTYKYINFNGHAYSSALIKQLSFWNVAKLFCLYALGYRTEAISVLGSNVMAKRGLIGLAEDSLTHSTAEVKAIFDVLVDESNYPILVHCTQGKDRTGLAVLLVLLLLNVPLCGIEQDYKMSEHELAAGKSTRLVQIRSIGLPDEFADCADDWAKTIIVWMNDKYGGITQYLDRCGIKMDQQNKVSAILRSQ